MAMKMQSFYFVVQLFFVTILMSLFSSVLLYSVS